MSEENLGKIESLEELLNLQKTFASIIRKPLIDNSKMQKSEMTEKIIKNNKNFSAHERLQFYSRQYWWRIKGAFDEDFLSVRLLAGKDKYIRLRDEYLLNFPSVSYTLRNLGSRFPKYMQEKDELLYNAALYDFARVEAFDLASLTHLSIEDCQKKGFESKLLTIQPYIRLLNLDYPINKIRADLTQAQRQESSNVIKNEDKIEEESEKLVEIKKEKAYLALHRVKGRVYVKTLKKYEFILLEKFRNKMSLSDPYLEELAGLKGNDDFSVQEFFKELMALNWLSICNNL